MRSIPTTPVAQLLWIVCIIAVLVMIFASAWAGLALMAVALVVAVVLRILGVK